MARILVADDNLDNLEIFGARLRAQGYEVVTAADGEAAVAVARARRPDLILLDIMMPKLNGVDVCRTLRADADMPFTPIIMVTAKSESKDVVAGLDAGADDYLVKPVDHAALLARVRSMLRIKSLHDTVEAQARELAGWNKTLEQRVADQVEELGRLGRLKRFFSPQLAEMIVAGGADDPLKSHRREVTVVFIDLRGFTAFAETADPEEVMAVLREYHAAAGQLVLAHEGTLERFAGDGMMVFFNDPVPVADAPQRAIRMAVAVRDRVRALAGEWRKRGYDLGIGIGIARGYATIGAIGFEGRLDYGAIGTVTNMAARLCGEAEPGQIIVSQRLLTTVEDLVEAAPVGELRVKGFVKPVTAFNIVALRPAA